MRGVERRERGDSSHLPPLNSFHLPASFSSQLRSYHSPLLLPTTSSSFLLLLPTTLIFLLSSLLSTPLIFLLPLSSQLISIDLKQPPLLSLDCWCWLGTHDLSSRRLLVTRNRLLSSPSSPLSSLSSQLHLPPPLSPLNYISLLSTHFISLLPSLLSTCLISLLPSLLSTPLIFLLPSSLQPPLLSLDCWCWLGTYDLLSRRLLVTRNRPVKNTM